MDTVLLSSILRRLADSLQAKSGGHSFRITVGFDGFVDQIIEVVDKRYSASDYAKIETIAQFGERIQRSAGLSTNIELVPKLVKIGGNGPIMANALARAGQKIAYLGALGTPEIEPTFHEFVKNCRQVVSFANPGRTDALEFLDGKILMGKLTSLTEITWESLSGRLSPDMLRELFAEPDLVATVNWTMIPYMNDLWENLFRFLETEQPTKRPFMFVDLCDPEKRSTEDIRRAMGLLNQFSRFYNVVLGLNLKEAAEVAKAVGIGLSQPVQSTSLAEITQELGRHLQLWGVVVHALKTCAAVCDGEFAEVYGAYCERPKLTTGAGDNFNAGFCLGLLLGLPLDGILALASACSGFYVRRGYSPNYQELQEFVVLWQSNIGRSF